MLVGFLVALYCLGYYWARSHHALIHRVSFATGGGTKRYFHRVSMGDFGPGSLQSSSTQFIVVASYGVFTPLRWLEALAWHLIPRKYPVSDAAAQNGRGIVGAQR
ncbi:MAG: hypothetical protein HYY24_30220 [Verrucomicrobia bacterium]|nr:hypothetical protein [Verrucomicrobiota bacterium]